jgi:hypothetical protein
MAQDELAKHKKLIDEFQYKAKGDLSKNYYNVRSGYISIKSLLLKVIRVRIGVPND